MKTIPEIMMKDHSKIHNLISEIEQNIIKNNNEDSNHLFIRLKWTLEKHFFIEEKVVFSIYSNMLPEEFEELNKLLQEHKDFLHLLNRIDSDFKNLKLFQKLKKELSAHAKFEDEIFYPRLEEQLSKEQKQLIYDRCKKWV